MSLAGVGWGDEGDEAFGEVRDLRAEFVDGGGVAFGGEGGLGEGAAVDFEQAEQLEGVGGGDEGRFPVGAEIRTGVLAGWFAGGGEQGHTAKAHMEEPAAAQASIGVRGSGLGLDGWSQLAA